MKNNDKFKAPRGSLYIPGGPVGVLLIHSLGGSPLELKLVANSLAREGYTVYCPVIPGLTFATDVSGMSTWRDWYQAAEQAFDHLASTCDQVLLGGSSAGAVLALRLAAYRQDEVSGMMLFAPTLSVNGWAIPYTLKLFHLVSDKWTARLFSFRSPAPHGIKDERVRKFALEAIKGDTSLTHDINTRGGGTVFEFFRLVRDVRRVLSSVRLNTLIFHPRHDDQSDIKNTMVLQRKLKGCVEVCVLEDSYHMVTLDRQRNYVADRTVEFATRMVARGEAAAAEKRGTARKTPELVRPQLTGAAE